MSEAVFVYGLLKPGFRLHHVVAPYVAREAAATVNGRLYDAGVPAARFDEDGTVEGHVLWLERPDEALATLDDLEDEGEVYRRILLGAETTDGTVDAYAYEYLLPLADHRPVGTSWL